MMGLRLFGVLAALAAFLRPVVLWAKAMPSAAEAAAKWKRNTAAAGQAYTEGVERVTESPTEAAAEAADRMLAGITEAIADGRVQAGLRRVTLQEWKQRTKSLGAQRLAQGVAESEQRTRDAMQENFQDIAAVRASLPPRGTLQENIERAAAFARGMAERKRSRAQ